MAANENFAESLIGSIIILYGAPSRGLIKPPFITTRFMPVFVILNLLSRLSDSLSINDDDDANYLQLNFIKHSPHNYNDHSSKSKVKFLSFAIYLFIHPLSLSLFTRILFKC